MPGAPQYRSAELCTSSRRFRRGPDSAAGAAFFAPGSTRQPITNPAMASMVWLCFPPMTR